MPLYEVIVHGPGGAGERRPRRMETAHRVSPGEPITVDDLGACLVEQVSGDKVFAAYAARFRDGDNRHVLAADDVIVIAQLLPAGDAHEPLPPGRALRALLYAVIATPRESDLLELQDGREREALVAALDAWRVQGGISELAHALWMDLTRE